MVNFIEGFPSYGTQEEKDLWFQRFAEQHNQLATTGTGGGGGTLTSGVQVNEDNEVIDTNRPGDRLGWAERYLHVRITSDADGQTRANPSDITGTLYVFVYNSNDPTTANIPADANFIQAASFSSWTSTMSLFFIPFGFNNARFEIAQNLPSGRTPILTANFRIDLEAGVGVGATGEAGAPAIAVNIEARMRPAGVAASSLVAPNTVNPADWDFAPDGLTFRNSDGATRSLVAFVQVGGTTQSLSNHQGFTYSWTRNGDVWTPSITGTDRMSRWIPIDANDVNGFSDQFIVDVDNIL